MPIYQVRRWKRYGHDRAYFADADGTKVGYLDLASGEHVLDEGADRDAIEAAALAWCADNEITPPNLPLMGASKQEDVQAVQAASAAAFAEDGAQSVAVPVAPAPPKEAEPEWTDLSAHRPGEGVRKLAEAEWTASKDRSKVFAALNRYVFDNHTDERAWRKGAEGEEYVGAKLDKLRDKGWHVLHSVPVGKSDSDIDHIAIGPGGVFTVNSKMHAGKKIWVAKYQMRVNGQPVPYLRNSRHEAGRAKKLLDAQLDFEVPVVGCVVVLTGSLVPEVTYKQMPDDVRVLDKWDLPKWFKKRPAVLSPEQVEAVFDTARRSTTWRTIE
ncbi:nuclease-related domain-containing protein [Demequina muriae]|uniref:Nuclease-related domain-containing protein n=1 Tax=Demequina muriae TaxID=3051664 RepID=A0ABT8GEM6_9MICO|nr:nuclease-related domain-containing protein [Demequina sp. EGI L300058]MDN4479719.1 nuclease-related domain-containing protein [Demequina sp. EGI L300058]